MPVMRRPPRAMTLVINAVIALPWRHAMQSRACVAEKSPLTNRIRRQFARIKATGWQCASVVTGTGGQAKRNASRRCQETQEASQDEAENPAKICSEGIPEVADVRQETSETLRRRRDRKRGRSCRRPSRFRLRRDRGSDARFRPRPPARSCDRPTRPSAPHG